MNDTDYTAQKQMGTALKKAIEKISYTTEDNKIASAAITSARLRARPPKMS